MIKVEIIEITIKRPSGQIETSLHPMLSVLKEKILSSANKFLKDNNKGEIIKTEVKFFM